MGGLLIILGLVALLLGLWGLIRGGIRWMRVGSRRASLLVFVGGFVALFVGAAITPSTAHQNGDSAPLSGTPPTAQHSTSTTSIAKHPAPTPPQPPLTNTDWPKVQQQPGAYFGRPVAIDAEVEQTDVPGFPPGTFTVSLTPQNDSAFARVAILPPTAAAPVKQYAILHILGTMRAPTTVETAMGASFSVAVVSASTWSSESYGKAFAPALETLTSIPSQSQNGLTVTITKVDVAANQTRVWLTAVNNAGTKAHLWAFEAALVQNGHRIQVDDNAGGGNNEGYPSLPDPLLNGTTTTAVLIFGAVKPGGGAVTVDLPAGSDDLTQNWSDFTFSFKP